MIAKINSGGIRGVDGYMVSVEVDISQGLPSFDIVGLPDSGVKESRERVRTAINNSNYSFPIKRITINLAPADTKKEGPSFDLPIAAGILACMGVIPYDKLQDVFITGELSLDGEIKAVNGVLPMADNAYKNNIRTFIVPYGNVKEAALIKGAEVYGVGNLTELIGHFTNKPLDKAPHADELLCEYSDTYGGLDFADVKGQENMKRAFEIAAAGYHNLITIGPPGSGKTMLAKRMPTILPALTFQERIEITKIYSVSGLIKNRSELIQSRPFRAPHHTISYSALVGGGRSRIPGEISLAHNGVLFLDELTEFHRDALEALRQPLEDHIIAISRAGGNVTYPANFLLICALNPCPCGFFGSSNKCTCSPAEIAKYLGKISGPLLDRIDLHVEAQKINYSELNSEKNAETSEAVRKRVAAAHMVQTERYKEEGISFNAQMNAAQTEKFCVLGKAEKELLRQVFDGLDLSARAYHKILKIARTIADLEGKEMIDCMNIAEAVSYRNLDRKYWA